MSSLKSQLEQIANEFVSSLLAAMKSAQLSELAEGSLRASHGVSKCRSKSRSKRAGFAGLSRIVGLG